MPTTKSCIKSQLENILYKVNKPSRYIGGEIGEIKKDFNSVDINFALVFPDMYELGASNLGCRILYDVLNKEDFIWAQRAYAPDVDMKLQMEENNIPLYATESKMPLNEFDIVSFSLQYEISFPTVLALLKLSKIPHRNDQRSDSDPIILAGGPASYNPLVMSEFIDVFTLGDGEEVLVEICTTLRHMKDKSRDEKLFALSKIKGCYVPQFYKEGQKVEKRICPLGDINALKNFPIPYSPCTHDRVVTEIRRGCGRMCRFCQSCFTNLPIRERSSEEIIDITDNLLANTGYEEYSLLSLSSNDYSNINAVVKELCAKHSPKGSSISLPSQRADSFNLELANMVQSVRKSTITFAPEAGSQRMRNVINKNLTEEQILQAVMTCYKAGWGKIKLYFMLGLPTETFEDLDEMIELLSKIKKTALDVKKENNYKHHLDLTCTVSTFVPKPHTPFQWFGQDSPELIQQKISYLISKVKLLRGVRLNFSDIFTSQLEAVFSRGDKKLCSIIEKAFLKGAYLDAWRENMDKNRWIEAAQEAEINLLEYSIKNIPTDETLPWDFIDTGVKKQWLINEYNQSLKDAVSKPCDKACSACGVCQTTGYKKVIFDENSYAAKEPQKTEQTKKIHSYRLVISKKNNLKYISHLDWVGTFYKVLKRSGLDIVFSQGFNPSPKISASVALPIFVESDGEFLDIELYDDKDPNTLKELIQSNLPEGAKIKSVVKIEKSTPSMDKMIFWGKYRAIICDKTLVKSLELRYKISELFNNEEIFIEKTTKKGLRQQINIRPSIKSIDVIDEQNGELEFIIKTGQLGSDTIRQLRADEFLDTIFPQINWCITRTGLLDENLKELLQDL
ncbi:MAG: TIGR03960 family B12-binding radical SAM protein [Candidatus Gastranaerophilales bacterium]|nr:TIGR03960 family B12-binding radical SAM protein [Candidatus Gastranaerophilales bacterium]